MHQNGTHGAQHQHHTPAQRCPALGAAIVWVTPGMHTPPSLWEGEHLHRNDAHVAQHQQHRHCRTPLGVGTQTATRVDLVVSAQHACQLVLLVPPK